MDGKGLTGTALKFVAMATMFCDHIGAYILEPRLSLTGDSPLDWMNLILRCIGRTAMPIFCFMIAEGFRHTHSVKKYALRLLLLAILSEIPYNLASSHRFVDISGRNVVFTLLLGLAALYGIDSFENYQQNRLRRLFQFFWVAAVCGMAELLRADYGYLGILLVILCDGFRGQPGRMTLAGVLVLFSYWPFSSIQSFGALAFLPLSLYNGRRTNRPASPMKRACVQYGFYLFYPAHMLLLYGLAGLLP